MALGIDLTKTLKNNTYCVDITATTITNELYLEAVRDYGEIAINFGGEIEDPNTADTILATLSLKNVKITDIPTHPVHQEFSTIQYPTNAKKIANAYYDMIKKRIEDYEKSKVAETDDFTSEETI